MEARIEQELNRIQDSLHTNITEKQYCELYAAQQALVWADNPDIAKSPFDTVMQGSVIYYKEPAMGIQGEPKDCLSLSNPV